MSNDDLLHDYDWRCGECQCHTYARIQEGGLKPSPYVRCVNCKLVSYFPARRPAPADGVRDAALDWQLAAFDATINLARRRGMSDLPPNPGADFAHICDMRSRIQPDFSRARLGRWLSWAQACVTISGCASLDDMKEINKQASEDARALAAPPAREAPAPEPAITNPERLELHKKLLAFLGALHLGRDGTAPRNLYAHKLNSREVSILADCLLDRALAEDRATRQAPAPTGVKVRGLEWKQTSPKLWEAKVVFGTYCVNRVDDETWMAFQYGDTFRADRSTIEDAKAAAQADFERRILACIDISHAPTQPVREGWQLAAFDETLMLANERGMRAKVKGGSALNQDHLEDMRSRITPHFSPAKVGRWLGWAQAAVVAAGCGTLAEMKAINEAAKAAAPSGDRAQDEV